MTDVCRELFHALAPLNTELADRIYQSIKDMPILDYHCHLSPKEIYEDKVFSDIGKMWLGGDHYKWRLMRARGVAEELITGGAEYKDKFFAYIGAVSGALGNPLRDFSRLELIKYFGIDIPISCNNAERIWTEANAVIAKNGLSPRKIIAMSDVEFIATTDDPTDDLEYHRLLKKERERGSIEASVTPTFRADRLFNLRAEDFPRYVDMLSKSVGRTITTLSDYLTAIEDRMVFFKQNGCRFADIGLEDFPRTGGNRERAAIAFDLALCGRAKEANVDAFLFFMYRFWLKKCREHGFIVQLHLNPLRNTNTQAYKKIGADSGFDAINNDFCIASLRAVLDTVETEGGLPRVIVYTLNPVLYYPLIALCGAFRGVTLGVAWWFNDNRQGIFDYLQRMSELTHIECVPGMLTDSRSFLSYARHDYFRMVLSAFLAQFQFEREELLLDTAKRLAYGNVRELIEEA